MAAFLAAWEPALEIDAVALLPREPASNKFDNVAVGDLSPKLMDRYVSATQKISRLAVGPSVRSPGGDTIRIPADRTQEEQRAQPFESRRTTKLTCRGG